MSAERLSNLAILSIENERAEKLDISKLVDIFVKNRHEYEHFRIVW